MTKLNGIKLHTVLDWINDPRMVGTCTRHSEIAELKGKTMVSTRITDIDVSCYPMRVLTENGAVFEVTGNVHFLRQLKPLLRICAMEKRHLKKAANE
jgi:hypothetical protein